MIDVIKIFDNESLNSSNNSVRFKIDNNSNKNHGAEFILPIFLVYIQSTVDHHFTTATIESNDTCLHPSSMESDSRSTACLQR